ncbi:Imm8 family immunity protein [Roseimaritima multifibrata]|uniref:Imm8 family immunity protein n=1 Tax=Roseimaritima multifibrata TaxID=1930274 RepID=UPI001C54DE5D|nr:Imm8 family immunity protein [Roseimaritima multifibrata]
MDDFISFVPPDVTVHYGWIVLVIGTDETDPEYFQCLVSTPLALEEALCRSKDCLVHIVERYEPANILSTLIARVENSKGNTWIEIVDQLRTFMRWERG